jgi:adenylate cyclase
MLVALTIGLALSLAALAVVSALLVRTRRELDAALAARHPPKPRPLQAAGRAVQAVVDTAVRVRSEGVTELLMSSMQDFSTWAAEDRAEIASTAAPDGTVTIFFSDIEDSTTHNERLGDARWVRVLRAHDRVVRSAVEAHEGHVVKTQGDGFMIVFGDPASAAQAALAIQAALREHPGRRLRGTPVAVRIGLHVGKVKSRDGDYFGRNVAFAARVAAQADGGQVLVSDDLRAALEHGDGFVFADVGEAELKGFADRHRLWLLTAPDPA